MANDKPPFTLSHVLARYHEFLLTFGSSVPGDVQKLRESVAYWLQEARNAEAPAQHGPLSIVLEHHVINRAFSLAGVVWQVKNHKGDTLHTGFAPDGDKAYANAQHHVQMTKDLAAWEATRRG